MAKSISLGLRTALESGNAVLFVGAGIGHNARGRDGRPAPDARELASELITQFGITPPSNIDLAQIAKVVEIRHGRAELEAFITKRLSGLEPDEHLQWLCSLHWRAIFTTNYDALI